MIEKHSKHNRFRESLKAFVETDPHLFALSKLKYQYSPQWWSELDSETPGIYILTGGRQVGKSTACKLLIQHYLQKKQFQADVIFYLPCDEIFDAKELSQVLRSFFDEVGNKIFLLVIDEITFVKDWDRVIKALADEGYFRQGLCLLTGSDTLILKEAAMRFPGRRGTAAKTDFHLYPLTFAEYVKLVEPKAKIDSKILATLFKNYLVCGGYLRAINDLAEYGEITAATYATYEQWIRGDFLKQNKKEETLMAILQALITVGVSQISYSGLTRKIGLISKDTLIDYCQMLERMDILINLQAFDQNKKQGFPRKDRKFHFTDPFIYHTIVNWLNRENYNNTGLAESMLVEACVASHCHRKGKTFYFKGQGEIDVVWLYDQMIQAIEVKWSEQLRASDMKMLKQFEHSVILTKNAIEGKIDHIKSMPVSEFLLEVN